MRPILAQAVKEWNQFRRDRLTLALSFVLPVVMLLLFGLAISLDPDGMRLVVEDLDNTPLSRSYVEQYAATNDFVMVSDNRTTELAEAIDADRARIAVRIPPHFERGLKRGDSVTVQVLIDGTDSNTANALRNTAKAVNQAFVARLVSPSGASTTLVEAQVRFWHNPGLADARFFGSGALGLVLVLFPALLGALASSREHEQGTIIQVYASTLSAPQWVVGKALPYVVIGFAELAICFSVGVAVFEYHVPTDPTAFLVGSFFYISAGVFYGLVVGNVMGTQSAAIQAVQLGAFVISMLLSGYLVPIANTPVELRWISYILPATYYIEITRDAVLRDGGWSSMGGAVGVLGVMMMFFFAANLRRMRRMQFAD